jgi:pyridoxamine 5'-phosphate oxidase
MSDGLQSGVDLMALRRDYRLFGLDESEAGDCPFSLFDTWLHAALEQQLPEPYAMTLATASADGVPSARVVLLRQFDANGLVFFTNYESRKGRDIESNPRASVVFFWPELERQVRFEGTVERISAGESDTYHLRRPPESRYGSAASPQSVVSANREVLERKVEELRRQFPEGVPRPEHWGGYRLIPSVVEFWQGRPSRLHDRIQFTRNDSVWQRERLAP